LRLTVVITTYERADALDCVLQSLARQTDSPDEVIVADDGSGAATRAVIERFAGGARYPVHHERHEHDGFRVCRIRNRAIAHASSDYIVQLDGDMVLHPSFLADHRAAARPGCFVQGTRVLCDATLTRTLLDCRPHTITPFTRGIGGLRRTYALHLPRLSNLFARLANGFIAVKGCNQGFWRADLERVNGYNEDMTGWGSEDKELAVRLGNAGVQRRTLFLAGIAYHLHHPLAARDRHGINQSILARTRERGLVRCEHGIV
jgi:glycosyltransferase involved in cell wall biosynthesis